MRGMMAAAQLCLEQRGERLHGRGHGRVDQARGHRVDPDAVGGPVGGQVAGEVRRAALAAA